MHTIKKPNQYWQQQEPTIQSMYKRWVPPHFNEEEISEIIGYLPNLANKRILDLAAGIGRFTHHFSKEGKELISVDIVSDFLEKNKKEHPNCTNVSFLCSNAMDLQFKDHYFDFVFINWLFIYLEDEEVSLLIDRIHRWLTPGGYFFFRETCNFTHQKTKDKNYYAKYRALSFYEGLIEKKFNLLKEGSIQAYINHFADPAQSFWLCKKSET